MKRNEPWDSRLVDNVELLKVLLGGSANSFIGQLVNIYLTANQANKEKLQWAYPVETIATRVFTSYQPRTWKWWVDTVEAMRATEQVGGTIILQVDDKVIIHETTHRDTSQAVSVSGRQAVTMAASYLMDGAASDEPCALAGPDHPKSGEGPGPRIGVLVAPVTGQDCYVVIFCDWACFGLWVADQALQALGVENPSDIAAEPRSQGPEGEDKHLTPDCGCAYHDTPDGHPTYAARSNGHVDPT